MSATNPQTAETTVLKALPTVEKLIQGSGISPKWKHYAVITVGLVSAALTYLSGYHLLTGAVLIGLVMVELPLFISDFE